MGTGDEWHQGIRECRLHRQVQGHEQDLPGAGDQRECKYGTTNYLTRLTNADAGRALNGLYTYSRVLEGDRFLVWIR